MRNIQQFTKQDRWREMQILTLKMQSNQILTSSKPIHSFIDQGGAMSICVMHARSNPNQHGPLMHDAFTSSSNARTGPLAMFNQAQAHEPRPGTGQPDSSKSSWSQLGSDRQGQTHHTQWSSSKPTRPRRPRSALQALWGPTKKCNAANPSHGAYIPISQTIGISKYQMSLYYFFIWYVYIYIFFATIETQTHILPLTHMFLTS